MRETPATFDAHLLHCVELPWYKGVFAISVGAFLALFLMLFQPFGVSNYDPHFRIDLEFVVYMVGAGLTTTAALAASEFVLRPLLLPRPGRRSLLAWLAWDYLLAGSVAFLYYNFLGDWHDFSWRSYFGFLPDVWLVISFPVAGFLFYLRHEAVVTRLIHLSAAAPAAGASAPAEMLHLSSDNDKEVLVIAASDLLYLESQDNYVAVVHLHQGERRSRLMRSTLARMASLLPARCVRCHRSFVVNLDRVRTCHGNHHGLQLYVEGAEEAVPVSRAYARSVLEALGAPAPESPATAD
ncbi:MAG: LytTR family DNA-binding domain-containing protein [Burkholderiales bacterium]